MKTKDMTVEQFIEAVKTNNTVAFTAVKAAETVVKDVYGTSGNYSVQTAVSFAVKRLKKAKSDESATDVTGILIGTRIPGGNGKGPTIYGFITGKKGIEVEAWHGVVDTGDVKRKVPECAGARLLIKQEDNEFSQKKEWWINNVVGQKPMTIPEIIEKLTTLGAIISLTDVHKLIKSTNPVQLVAIKATLTGATASRKFDSEDKLPVWTKNDKYEGPNFSIRTKKEGDTMAWLRMVGTGLPYILVEDLVDLCRAAIENYENPEDQANFISSAIDERHVIAIVSVSKITDDGGEYGKSINANVLAIMDAPDNIQTTEVKQGQQKIDDTPTEPEKPVVDAPPLEEAAPVAAPVVEEVDLSNMEPGPIGATETPTEETPAEKTKEMAEIESKLLFAASMKCGVPGSAMRSQKIAALKKTSLEDLKKMGAMKKLPIEVVEIVYNNLINETA